jgi:hypothetical protein
MTKLSIFLWLADTITGLNDFFVLFAIFGIMAGIATVFLRDELEIPSWIPKVVIPLSIVSALIACVIPNKKTIYMIAGVELANTVMESEDFNKVKSYLGNTGVEMIDDIKAIIHAEAQEALEKSKKEK